MDATTAAAVVMEEGNDPATAIFDAAIRELDSITWCTEDCVPKDQAYIDATYAKVVKAFEDLPAGQVKTAYAKKVSIKPCQYWEVRLDEHDLVMNKFVARCAELRDVNGKVLLAGGKLTQIRVGDGNYYGKAPRRNLFQFRGCAGRKRIPLSEWTLADRDSKTMLDLIQTHGIDTYMSTWKGVLDIPLLYRLLDDRIIATAAIRTTESSELFELWKSDNAVKRNCVMSCNTTDHSSQLETVISVAGREAHRKLTPTGWVDSHLIRTPTGWVETHCVAME